MTVKLRVGQKLKDSLGGTWEVIDLDYFPSLAPDHGPHTYFKCKGTNRAISPYPTHETHFYFRYKDFSAPSWEHRFHLIKPGPETLDDLIEL